MQHFHCMHMLLCLVYIIEWLRMTSYFLGRLTSMQLAKLPYSPKFLQHYIFVNFARKLTVTKI